MCNSVCRIKCLKRLYYIRFFFLFKAYSYCNVGYLDEKNIVYCIMIIVYRLVLLFIVYFFNIKVF